MGHKDDTTAQNLFQACLRYPSYYKRLEWWDFREGRLPNRDVQYPELRQAAAFIWTSHTCSPPIFEPSKLAARVDKLLSVRGALLARKSPLGTICWTYRGFGSVLAHVVGLSEHEHQFQLHKAPMNDGLS